MALTLTGVSNKRIDDSDPMTCAYYVFPFFAEYPNDPNGVSCNEKDENDTPNFLEFLKVLRKKLDATFKNERKWISASVGATVFKGSNQESLSKLDSEWGTVLDAFQIMASENDQGTLLIWWLH